MMASKAPFFGKDTVLSAIFVTDYAHDQKHLGRQERIFNHDFRQKESKHILIHCNLAKFSENEMWVALALNGNRHLTRASPHDNLWGTRPWASEFY